MNHHHEIDILPVIDSVMPNATYDEKIEASHELSEFIDALWSIAERLAREENEQRPRPAGSPRCSSAPYPQLPLPFPRAGQQLE